MNGLNRSLVAVPRVTGGVFDGLATGADILANTFDRVARCKCRKGGQGEQGDNNLFHNRGLPQFSTRPNMATSLPLDKIP